MAKIYSLIIYTQQVSTGHLAASPATSQSLECPSALSEVGNQKLQKLIELDGD